MTWFLKCDGPFCEVAIEHSDPERLPDNWTMGTLRKMSGVVIEHICPDCARRLDARATALATEDAERKP